MKVVVRNAFIPTDSEVAANHAGMNTFFGAVLGFVMAGSENLDQLEFAYMLMVVAATVISILYVSASRQKVAYAAVSVAAILLLPRTVGAVLEKGEGIPPKLQATLLVWTAMSILVEFLPRRPNDQPSPAKKG